MLAIDTFRPDARTRQGMRLPNDWAAPSSTSHRDHALCTEHARRQALVPVEINVLASKTLGLTHAEIQTIYRVQLPIVRQHEAETHYGATGRNVFTPSQDLSGLGPPREAIGGDTSYTLRTPDGTEGGIALGWSTALVRAANGVWCAFNSPQRERCHRPKWLTDV